VFGSLAPAHVTHDSSFQSYVSCLQLIPALHVVTVHGGRIVVLATNIANRAGQFVLEEFTILSRRVTRGQTLQFFDFLYRSIVYSSLFHPVSGPFHVHTLLILSTHPKMYTPKCVNRGKVVTVH
jgi:hypothetical protein